MIDGEPTQKPVKLNKNCKLEIGGNEFHLMAKASNGKPYMLQNRWRVSHVNHSKNLLRANEFITSFTFHPEAHVASQRRNCSFVLYSHDDCVELINLVISYL